MQIDIILREDEVEQAIYDYCFNKGVINSNFEIVKKYPTIYSYTFSDMMEDIDEANKKISNKE